MNKKVLAIALAVLLCCSFTPSAWAADSDQNASSGTAQNEGSEKADDPGKPSDSDTTDSGSPSDSGAAEYDGDAQAEDHDGEAEEDGAPAATIASPEASADATDDGIAAFAVGRAAIPEGIYLIRSALSYTQVLDIAGGSSSDGANVQVWESNMTGAQRFKLTFDSKGGYTITNAASGKALDVAWGSKVSGANVQQYHANGSAAQRWAAKQNPDGSWSFLSALGNNLVLDVSGASSANGANMQVFTSNGTVAQRFWLIPVSVPVPTEKTLEPGVYSIKSMLGNGGYSLDVTGGSKDNGTRIQIWGSNNTLAQRFRIDLKANGYYTIRALNSAKALDVDTGNLVPTTKVQQWAYLSDNANQEWAICGNGDGTYTFAARTSGLVLDVAGGLASNGTKTQIFESNGTPAQRWKVAKIDASTAIAEGVYALRSTLTAAKYVDVKNASRSAGARIQLWGSNGHTAQKFQIKKTSDGYYTLQSLCSGMYLSASGSNVVQNPVSNGDDQKWSAELTYGGYVLKNKQKGLVLDVSGGGTYDGCSIGLYQANGTGAQTFDIIATPPISSGLYEIRSAIGNRALDVASGSVLNGGNIQVWTANNTGAQKWQVTEAGNGYVTIVNARSRKAVDVHNGSSAAGTNVQQWTASQGNRAQLFKAVPTGDGYFYIESACGGQNLAVSNAGNFDGANIAVYKPDGGKAQKFRFEPTTYVGEYDYRIATFQTVSTNTSNGTYNMMRALNSFNGLIVKPGQTISFFGVAGPCGAAQGYLPAGVVGGIGYGGGICQASTTLYGAVTRAGMTIVERRNHSVPSTYVPIGQDAMVDFGSSDFKFRNDHDFPVKIAVTCQGSTLQCDVYGIYPGWFDYIDVRSWWTGSRSAAAQRVYYLNGREVLVQALPSSFY